MLSLSDVARMAGTDLTTIKALNPNLKRDTLPPTIGPFYLRIPVGSHERFTAAFDALPPESKRPSGEYIVRRGDTLSGIGSQFGVSVSRLMQKNGLRSTNIRIGQRLVVPVTDYTGSVAEARFADSSEISVLYQRRVNRPIMDQQNVVAQGGAVSTTSSAGTPIQQVGLRTTSSYSSTASNQPETNTRITHVVRRGDTLGAIGERYKVSVRKLQGWNQLSGSRINVGQRLTIYTDGRSAPAARSGPVIHRIRRGDTLSEIADTYDVTVSELRRWNDLRGSNIRIGQRLSIYATPDASDVVTHTVRRGDTLIKIAQRNGVSVAKIKEWNNLASNTIRIGQSLKIFR